MHEQQAFKSLSAEKFTVEKQIRFRKEKPLLKKVWRKVKYNKIHNPSQLLLSQYLADYYRCPKNIVLLHYQIPVTLHNPLSVKKFAEYLYNGVEWLYELNNLNVSIKEHHKSLSMN